MDTIDTYDSTDTFLSDGPIRSLKLGELCEVIRKHRSLQHARIVAAEGYARSTGSITHRFLLLKLERTGRRPVWLRIDRQRVKGNVIRFIARMGISEVNDAVRVLQSPALYCPDSCFRLCLPPKRIACSIPDRSNPHHGRTYKHSSLHQRWVISAGFCCQ